MTTPAGGAAGGDWQPRLVRRLGEPPQQPARRARRARRPPQPAPFDPAPEQPPTPIPEPPRRLRQPSGGGGQRPPSAPRGSGPGAGALLLVLLIVLAAAAVIVLFFEPGLIETDFLNNDDTAVVVESEAPLALGAVTFDVRLMQQVPEIPEILGVASPIYELYAPDSRLGPFEFTLRLTNPTQDARNLGAYTWNGEDWVRLGDALLSSDGSSARIVLSETPDNLVILRRLQFRDVIAGRVPRGEEPQPILAGSLTVVHPDGWQPGADGSLLGGVQLSTSVVFRNVWPTVSAGAEQVDLVNDILASDSLRQKHISSIQFAIQNGQYDGVDIHYLDVAPSLRQQFTAFISELAERLHRDDRGVAVHIPITASGGVGEGAYDLTQLGAAADFIVIEPPLDPTLFEAAITASLPTLLERVDSNQLLLALRANAVVHSSTGFSEISQREALGLASRLSIREVGPYRPSARVTLQGNAILLDNQSSGLHWDDLHRVVSFTYRDQAGEAVTIWIHNRFSASFQLKVVSDWELGGAYISNASSDPANANLWPAIAAFFESGIPDLRLPNPILFDPVFSVEGGTLTGNSSNGWQFWDLPPLPGNYFAQLVVSDGDVRVGHEITVPVQVGE